MAESRVVMVFRIAVLVTLLGSAQPYNFLISHPFYGASHVLTLRAVTENLLSRFCYFVKETALFGIHISPGLSPGFALLGVQLCFD